MQHPEARTCSGFVLSKLQREDVAPMVETTQKNLPFGVNPFPKQAV